ncbi:hypothetical protein P376_5638 [Streptomyces sp. HCCB10043]|nr:hypothetical protein P376_5638 [Streptomyces sp. HCCB10043]
MQGQRGQPRALPLPRRGGHERRFEDLAVDRAPGRPVRGRPRLRLRARRNLRRGDRDHGEGRRPRLRRGGLLRRHPRRPPRRGRPYAGRPHTRRLRRPGARRTGRRRGRRRTRRDRLVQVRRRVHHRGQAAGPAAAPRLEEAVRRRGQPPRHGRRRRARAPCAEPRGRDVRELDQPGPRLHRGAAGLGRRAHRGTPAGRRRRLQLPAAGRRQRQVGRRGGLGRLARRVHDHRHRPRHDPGHGPGRPGRDALRDRAGHRHGDPDAHPAGGYPVRRRPRAGRGLVHRLHGRETAPCGPRVVHRQRLLRSARRAGGHGRIHRDGPGHRRGVGRGRPVGAGLRRRGHPGQDARRQGPGPRRRLRHGDGSRLRRLAGRRGPLRPGQRQQRHADRVRQRGLRPGREGPVAARQPLPGRRGLARRRTGRRHRLRDQPRRGEDHQAGPAGLAAGDPRTRGPHGEGGRGGRPHRRGGGHPGAHGPLAGQHRRRADLAGRRGRDRTRPHVHRAHRAGRLPLPRRVPQRRRHHPHRRRDDHGHPGHRRRHRRGRGRRHRWHRRRLERLREHGR